MKQASILLLTFLLLSCGKKYECEKENLPSAFVGYADAEIDSVVLRRFKPGTAFSQQADSVLLSPANVFFSRHGDTVEFSPNAADLRLNGSYDYQLVNLFDHKITTLTDMAFRITERKSGGIFSMDPGYCASPLTGYKLNGAFVTVPAYGGNKHLYLHK